MLPALEVLLHKADEPDDGKEDHEERHLQFLQTGLACPKSAVLLRSGNLITIYDRVYFFMYIRYIGSVLPRTVLVKYQPTSFGEKEGKVCICQ